MANKIDSQSLQSRAPQHPMATCWLSWLGTQLGGLSDRSPFLGPCSSLCHFSSPTKRASSTRECVQDTKLPQNGVSICFPRAKGTEMYRASPTRRSIDSSRAFIMRVAKRKVLAVSSNILASAMPKVPQNPCWFYEHAKGLHIIRPATRTAWEFACSIGLAFV